MADSFDVIVIGGGPGGYVAAIRAAQLGKKTAVVERDKAGGRCLNYACIPAKTILRTAEIYTEARESAELGVVAKDVSLDWDAVGKRRAAVSESLSGGVKMLWDKNKVTVIEGEGSLTAEGNVKVGEEAYEAGAVILATGSVASPIPGVEFGERVVDTWGAWSLPQVPKKIAVVGAGASGCEIASAYGRFGTEVLLIEMLPQIMPGRGQGRGPGRRARLQEAEHHRRHRQPGRERRGRRGVGQVHLRRRVGRGRLPLHRRRPPRRHRGPRPERGRGRAGGERQGQGRRATQRTTNPKVYAIGDLVNAKALAHKAAEEGVVAVEAAAGAETHPVDQNLVAGATSATRRSPASGSPRRRRRRPATTSRSASSSSAASAAATVYDDKEGLVKIVADSKYGEILGVHIVGNRACDMIAELVATMALEGGYQELARIVHPHPTISEAIFEAARAVDGWATHA